MNTERKAGSIPARLPRSGEKGGRFDPGDGAHGEPNGTGGPPVSFLAESRNGALFLVDRETVIRFAEKYTAIPIAGCWIWTAAAGRYGAMARDGVHMDAHRVSWLIHRGQIPAGMRVCHRCDVCLCVNPNHLFLATAKENTQDMLAKGRHKYGTWNAPRGDNHWTRRNHA